MSVSDRGSKSDVNYALLWTLMAHGVLVQIITGMVRVTTSYRIVDLNLDVIWYGIIPATFALFPIFLAVSVGRFIDRNHDAHAAMIGSGMMLAAVGACASPIRPGRSCPIRRCSAWAISS